ncbi:MAG: preprotein translocase subunit SecA [Chlamydiota bacterium]|nr:preprotein translocase subunit SecA [Chlamydiota bacterium]
MLQWILSNTIGTKNEREVKKLDSRVQLINAKEEEYQRYSEDQLKALTIQFKERLSKGETTDDLLIEAFAAVKNVCRRLCGQTWEVRSHPQKWNMIPFDVQIVGGIVLFQGKIAEMATGEGKTLAATMPVYLNALAGQVHLVTVNDYLARRDCEWMGPVYQYLGLSVASLYHDMNPQDKRNAYTSDILYGTNSEFGFDYLRDNSIATNVEEQVQREHFYAIVDEVDSILVDEARTPLIISGPSTVSTHRYDMLKPLVKNLVEKQNNLCSQLLKDIKPFIDAEKLSSEEEDRFSVSLYQVQKGTPRNKQLLKILEGPRERKMLEKIDLQLSSDLRKEDRFRIKEELYYVIDEKGHDVDLSEKGRKLISPNDPDEFVLPDIIVTLQDVDADQSLTQEEKEVKKEKIQKDFNERSEKIHDMGQLLRAYSLFEKDVAYVVQDNKVMIVDEFTGRMMPGRRFSDGLHQALEAKENVKIEKETQTYATITIQNYFRMYKKLAGMTGTAETEANEFYQIYKLPVVVIPTNKPIYRQDWNDVIYKTRREKYNAIINEIDMWHAKKRPVLVGTISVDASELISRMLKRKGIKHSVLNARYHEQEAEIIMNAGNPGAVTIATNMAGRGTDIKLAPEVLKLPGCEISGLHVIGSERHESRRIDRQLRGRSGRQGDPGSSRFYISLEDDLMRLFGSDRIAKIMEKMGMKEGEELTHRFLTRSIETAQKRVEQRNFGIRKHTLEYDDVMNKQREVIYNFRNHVLKEDNLKDTILEIIEEVLQQQIELYLPEKGSASEQDFPGLLKWIDSAFPLHTEGRLHEFESKNNSDLFEMVVSQIKDIYQTKEAIEGPAMRQLERLVLLGVIDRLWKEHLYNMDSLREAVYLRAYGQKDPLVEYRTEGYGMFTEMMSNIKTDAARDIFRISASKEYFEMLMKRLRHQHIRQEQASLIPETENVNAQVGDGVQSRSAQRVPIKRESPKIGRNDPCPCGSNKKYKKCCGQQS